MCLINVGLSWLICLFIHAYVICIYLYVHLFTNRNIYKWKICQAQKLQFQRYIDSLLLIAQYAQHAAVFLFYF